MSRACSIALPSLAAIASHCRHQLMRFWRFIFADVRFWHLAAMPLVTRNVRYRRFKADITQTGPICPPVTQTGHEWKCQPLKRLPFLR